MKTKKLQPPPGDAAADEKAVMDSFINGIPLDPVVSRRVHERARQIRDEIRQRHGLVDIAVPAIRELRGPLPE